MEAATDPTRTGWSGGLGGVEIGDKCGNQLGVRNSAGADVYLNGSPYSVQMIWSSAVAACAMSRCRRSVCATAPDLQQTVAAGGTGRRTFAVSIRVRNPSDTDAAVAAVVSDVLPDGVAYAAGSASPAPTSVSGRLLTWNLGTIAVRDERAIVFQARAASGARSGASVRSCARLQWADALGEPQPPPAASCTLLP